MRNPPPTPDPYRALGLEPGATMAEVKRAYRRLAKAFHPDSAGEAALPRFLAIHEAYERIRTGKGASGLSGVGDAPNAGWASTPAEPWRADPSRARAARERASSARGRPGAAGSRGSGARSGARPGGGAGAAGPASAGSGPSAAGTGRSGGGSARPGGATSSTGGGYGGRASRRRDTRKATLGSTSYDEARDPSDASWSGASWYGPTTGEYWIINPREYADPRKHGPDYQSRARRPIGEAPDEIGAADANPFEPEATADTAFEDVTWDDRSARERSRDGWPGADTESTSRDRPGASAPRSAGPARPAGRARSAGPAGSARAAAGTFDRRWSGPGPRAGTPEGGAGRYPGDARGVSAGPGGRGGAGSSVRDLLGGPADDPIRRLGVALIAWPPIGLAAAGAIGEVTGCSSFAAACSGTEPLLPWLAQAAILGFLLLLPPIARVLAGGAIAVVLALVPLTGFLVVIGGTGAPQAGFVLAVLLALAWLVGVAWSVAAARRRGPPLGVEGGP